MSSPPFRRPISFSESHIQLPRIASRERPFLAATDVPGLDLGLGLSLEESPSTTTLIIPSPPPPLLPATEEPWHSTAHIWAVRFIFHIVLISLFETLFFWFFISRTEDAALETLVSSYTSNLLSACHNLTPSERTALLDIMNLFINPNATAAAAAAAAADRAAFNGVLLRNSWLYFGGGVGLFLATAGAAAWRRLQVRWGHVFAENLVLVLMLGVYEWMFFSTVVLQYRAVTPPELDGMVVAQLEAAC